MSTVETAPAIHTHKANFGRYVADCPKCAEKYPNGPPDRKMIRRHVVTAAEKRSAMEAEIRAQVLAEMAAQVPQAPVIEFTPAVAVAAQSAGMTNEQFMEAMRVFGTELRKPDPEVQAEREARKIREQISKDNERQLIAERVALVNAEQLACDHKMSNGVSRVRGQVHNDGMYHGFCTWCQKAFTPRVLSQQERAMMGA